MNLINLPKTKSYESKTFLCCGYYYTSSCYSERYYKKVKTVKILLENVEALAWGEGPGDKNHRRDQAVNCPEPGKGSWNVKTGCCWGYTTCRFEICEGQSGF